MGPFQAELVIAQLKRIADALEQPKTQYVPYQWQPSSTHPVQYIPPSTFTVTS